MSHADEEEAQVRAVHERYFQALGAGDMDAVAAQFTFPAAFKGFLDDVVIADDPASLLATYRRLIAAAPKAARNDVLDTSVSFIRPGVYSLSMHYRQYDGDNTLIHEGRAIYFMKRIGSAFKLFAVF
jgi:hypothetical protein